MADSSTSSAASLSSAAVVIARRYFNIRVPLEMQPFACPNQSVRLWHCDTPDSLDPGRPLPEPDPGMEYKVATGSATGSEYLVVSFTPRQGAIAVAVGFGNARYATARVISCSAAPILLGVASKSTTE